MSATATSAQTAADLQRILTQVDSAALLVPPRILRRVIKLDRALTGPGLQVPHRKSYVLDRDRLLSIADRGELGVEPGRDLPPTLLLLPRPDSHRLARREGEPVLLKYWRLLFHARVHLALQARHVSDAELRDRIRRIGRTEFGEVSAVLRQENYLLPPGDDRAVYEEFVAVYLELRHFAPHRLAVYFPTCSSFEAIDAVLALDVDAAALFAATRLPGAPDPAPPPPNEPEELARTDDEPDAAAPSLSPNDRPRAYRRLLRRAEGSAARGNLVRAAVFRMRAVALAPPGQANPTRAAARRDIEQFSQRLQSALGYSDAVAGDWRQALLALLEPAARGVWPSESRMLYDLQTVCMDQERPIYALDLVEWFVSWGRRPVKRSLPFQGEVQAVRHLRRAAHRLTAIRIPEPIRRRLIPLLLDAGRRSEHRLRERLRPVVRGALDKVGLAPRNVAEEVARDKVAEELIDHVVERGFLGMGDLRDTIARNRLKLADLTAAADDVADPPLPRWRRVLRRTARGLRTFFLGDALIRANRRLAVDLDGVYHRGEIYLRWLQRLTAAAFGTRIGRLLTLYVALPFGCSIALLKVWQEVAELIEGGPPEGSEEAAEAARHVNPYAFVGLGLFFLALFHVGPFRRVLLVVCLKLWAGLRWLLTDLPAWLLRLPWVERVLQSRPWLFCYQFIVKPLPWAALLAILLARRGVDWRVALGAGGAVFAVVSLLLNSRLGRDLEEVGADRLVRSWHLLRSDLVPGLVRWVLYLFRRLQEEVERVIYTVDEWLRFRPGDSRLSLFTKPILGLLWFCVTYLFRVVFNLFVEPTFNPIKHFPTVTVAAKLMAPLWFQVPQIVEYLEPVMGKLLASMVVPAVLTLVPGLAGFLVWEFKENWRLYRANQSPVLDAEIVGHHGETVLRLMRPGLHSGTLPKLYARLRHGRGRSPRKQYEALHHLGERMHQFTERNLFAVLVGSRSWGSATPLSVGKIKIGTNRIRLELCGPGASVHVDFEEHGGRLTGGLTCLAAWPETWLAQLLPEQAPAFRDALGGWYKLAGVELVREQVQALLPAGADYDVTAEGLIVWPAGEAGKVVHDLSGGLASAPAAAPLTADALLYSATPIYWLDWVQSWQLDHDGKGHAPLLPPRVRLLPEIG